MHVAHLHREGSRLGALFASAVVAASFAVVGVVTTAVPAGADDTVIYERDQTIPVPPASTYSGSAGGDGWNVALSDTQVFNVFHHSSDVTVACHQQSDAAECYPARTLV